MANLATALFSTSLLKFDHVYTAFRTETGEFVTAKNAENAKGEPDGFHIKKFAKPDRAKKIP
ncbi:MAG: hypothetical protein U9P12_07765, partial [Verrucomicrobiota bacterium]|nr:hypothetical protein [Verrucomicrobiota bacterium]